MQSSVVSTWEVLAQLFHDCSYNMISQGSVFQRAIVDSMCHQCVTCVSQLIYQGCISEGSVTRVRELLEVAIDKECFDLFFRIIL
jgi:hypothetical protein